MQSITSGTLNDQQIQHLCENQKTLIRQHFNPNNIKQACYELRASSVYYELNNSENKVDVSASKYSYILIKPKQSIVIITLEELELPKDIIGRILTKGKLFSIGLLPVNTYADPGFQGNLGIVFYNSSLDYIKIYPEEAIAKIEFSKLEVPVTKDYKGQHGYQTKIWPIPKEMRLTEKEIKDDPRIRKLHEEVTSIYGNKFVGILTRLLRFEKVLLFSGFAYFFFALALLALAFILDKKEAFNPIWTILIGLITNLISSFIMFRAFKKAE